MAMGDRYFRSVFVIMGGFLTVVKPDFAIWAHSGPSVVSTIRAKLAEKLSYFFPVEWASSPRDTLGDLRAP